MGDGKLFQHEDRVNSTSSDEEDGIFRNHRNFPTVFCSLAKEYPDNFPTNESSKAATAGLDPTTFRVTIHYSTTAPHSLYSMSSCVTALSFPSSARNRVEIVVVNGYGA